MVVPALCSVRWAHFHPIVTSVWRADSAQLERCILELNVCFQPLWAVSFGSNGENRSRPRGLSSHTESWPVQGWINVTNCVSDRELMSYLDLVLQVFVCTCMFTCVWTDYIWRDINLVFTPVCQIFSPLSPLLQPTALCTFMCVCLCVCTCACMLVHVQVFRCKYMCAHACGHLRTKSAVVPQVKLVFRVRISHWAGAYLRDPLSPSLRFCDSQHVSPCLACFTWVLGRRTQDPRLKSQVLYWLGDQFSPFLNFVRECS